jgi:hypothetical protein
MPLVTAGPQGTTGYAEGRPRVHEVFRYWPCLINADGAQSRIDVFDAPDTLSNRRSPAAWPRANLRYEQVTLPEIMPTSVEEPKQTSCLGDIAYGRSGDKGTAANIGILVRSPEHFAWLKTWLTPERVAQYFEPIGIRSVERFELPNLGGLNFVVRGILRRGLRNDAQGKALAQALLLMPLDSSTK